MEWTGGGGWGITVMGECGGGWGRGEARDMFPTMCFCSIPASSDSVESDVRQMKQSTYIKKKKSKQTVKLFCTTYGSGIIVVRFGSNNTLTLVISAGEHLSATQREERLRERERREPVSPLEQRKTIAKSVSLFKFIHFLGSVDFRFCFV
jgi:hypothetical protein